MIASSKIPAKRVDGTVSVISGGENALVIKERKRTIEE